MTKIRAEIDVIDSNYCENEDTTCPMCLVGDWGQYYCALFDNALEMDEENHSYCKRCEKCKQAEVKEMKPIEKMADYIYYTSPCICEICADRERCDAKLKKAWKGHEYDLDFVPPTPQKKQCINGILKFFEKDSE